MRIRGRASGVAVATVAMAAVIALAGCAASSAPSPSPTASSASPSPSPTPTAVAAIVPFGGDCSRVATSEQVGHILGREMSPSAPSTLEGLVPDFSTSFALLGAVRCSWISSALDYASIEIAPVDQVPAAVASTFTEFTCQDSRYCGRAETMGATWVNATVDRELAQERPMAEDERARVSAKVTALLDLVRAATTTDLAAQAATRLPAWWSMPTCDALQETVFASSGMHGGKPGFPSDSLPTGAAWDTAVAQGIQQWCPWYTFDAATKLSTVELDIQPGIGMPTADELDAAAATPTDVSGATAAYIVSVPARESGRRVIAVSGPNRLSVTGFGDADIDRLIAVAGAVLAHLDAG